jgi:hypothetical protein
MWKFCLLLALPGFAQFHLDSASPGTPSGLGTDTVTIATPLSMSEGDSSTFSVTAPDQFDLVRSEWRLDGELIAGAESSIFSFFADFATVAHPARQGNPTLSVTAFGAGGGTAIATWTAITVVDVDQAPSPPSIGIAPAAPLTSDIVTGLLLSQTADPDGDAISYVTRWLLAEGATIETATLAPGNTVYAQEWQLQFIVITDPYGEGPVTGPTASHSFSIANAAPTAQPVAPILAVAGRGIDLSLTGTDPDQHATSAIISRPPQHGTLQEDGDTAGDFVYTPAADFAGTDDFAFFVRDSVGAESATETVTIVVGGWEFELHIGALRYRIGMHSGASGPQDAIRPIADSASFVIPTDGSDVTWDPGAVPALGLRIVLPEGAVDMSSTESAAPPVGDFTIHYGLENYPLPVHRGWNLISLPVQPPDDRPSVVFPGMRVLTWLPTQELAVAESIRAGHGYFIHHPRAAGSLVVRGLASTETAELHSGWNLSGGGPLFETAWHLGPSGYRRTFAHQAGRAAWTYNTDQ